MTSSRIFSGVSAISLPAAATGGSSPLTLRDMLFFLRIRWPWILVTTSAFLALAGVYVLTAKPTFVASTQLLVFPQVNGSEAQRVLIKRGSRAQLTSPRHSASITAEKPMISASYHAVIAGHRAPICVPPVGRLIGWQKLRSPCVREIGASGSFAGESVQEKL